nr:MAG TPA: hypothetical protein [Caudoviricetes sp.]
MEQPQRPAALAAAGHARTDPSRNMRTDWRPASHLPTVVHTRPAHSTGGQRGRGGSTRQRGKCTFQKSAKR